MKEDFIFDLNEVLQFLVRNFPSFIDYLKQSINKTQIDFIVENSQHLCPINDISDDQFFNDFMAKIVENSSFLTDENQLIELVKTYLNESHSESSLTSNSSQIQQINSPNEDMIVSEELSLI